VVQASEYDTQSDEEPEEDGNGNIHESGQEVTGRDRELKFPFMALSEQDWDIPFEHQIELFCGHKRYKSKTPIS